MVSSPYESNYQESYDDVYKCVMGVSPPRGGSRAVEGGKAIASGGYGCVLRPAIRCDGEPSRQEGAISKLLTKDAAVEEMDDIETALEVIRKIPNYEKYFAVTGYRICMPAKLENEDRKKFNEHCSEPLGLTTKDFNRKRASELRAIISPDLGTDVSKSLKDLLAKPPKDLKRFLGKFNMVAADFLENGIAQLQKHNYYHSDVKPQNMMTSVNKSSLADSFNYIKLIDFGLALPPNANADAVNSSLLFNFPFTSEFFDTANARSLNRKINRSIIDGKLSEELLESARHVFFTSMHGHAPYILEVGQSAFNMTNEEYREYISRVWAAYVLAAVKSSIEHMGSKEIRFSREPYWKVVYRFNLDVWGFLTTFLLLASYANRNGKRNIAEVYLDRIVTKFLYNPVYGGKKIPINQVSSELRSIAREFGYSSHNDTPAKKTTLKTITNLDDRLTLVDLTGKRCPKGYIRHKTLKSKCVKRTISVKKLGKPKTTKQSMKRVSRKSTMTSPPHRKRCPLGYRRHATKKNKCVRQH
jgi:serine/threonine protein kinase